MIRFLCSLIMIAALTNASGESIFIIGNSLSRHAPRPDIGWQLDNGMAATEPEKDYAHIIRKRVSELTGREADLTISRMNMEANMAGLPVKMPEHADIVILQVGDNYKGKLAPEEARKRYGNMLKTLKETYPGAVIVAVSDWRSGPTELMRTAAAANDIPWVSIKAIGQNPKMSAAAEKHFSAWAINWHPGNAGMAAIADEIWKTLKPLLLNRPAAKDAAGTTGIVPEPQEVTLLEEGGLPVEPSLVLYAPSDCAETVKTGIDCFLKDFKMFYGFEPKVSFTLSDKALILGRVDGAPRPETPATGYDAYVLRVTGQGAVLTARTDSGLFYGVQTFRQLLRNDKTLPSVLIRDWSDQKWRMVYSPPYDPQWIIPKMARMKVNMCIMESYWNASRNWWFNPNAKNRAEAEKFISLARQYNIEVVPLVQGGGWSYGVIDQNPNCAEGIWVPDEKMVLTGEYTEFAKRNVIRTPSMPIIVTSPDGKTKYVEAKDYEIVPGKTARPFKDENAPWRLKRLAQGRLVPGIEVRVDYNYMNYSPHQTPYCPAEPLTYEILNRTLENVVRIYKPKYIHIGHDEVIYRERCRRCLQSGKTNLELMKTDLKFWYDKIKSLDPEITILSWDDLFRRESRDGEALLDSVPHDVIVCPWVYQGNLKAMQRIQDRVNWFLLEKKRIIVGTASGYFHENNLLWRSALKPYRDNPNNLGLMFSHWGESLKLWGAFPTAAELMWSADKPNDTQLRMTYGADYEFGRRTGWRAALEYEPQRVDFAKKINRGDRDMDEIQALIDRLDQMIVSRRLPGFQNTDGIFPEQTASQMRRLGDWYRAMLIYRDILGGKNASGDRIELFRVLKLAAPLDKDRWDKLANRDEMPSSEEIFGVEIKPPLPVDGQTDFYPLRKFGKVVDEPGARTIEFNGIYRIGGVEFSSAEPGMYRVFTVAKDEKWRQQAEIIIGDSRKGVVHWAPVETDRVRVVSNEPKENIRAELLFFAAKDKTIRKAFKTVMVDFVDSHGEMAAWDTRAVMSLENDQLRVDFDCRFDPARKLISRGGALYEDDCVELFLRDSTGGEHGFLQIVVNSEGRSKVIAHDRSATVPKVKAKVNTASGRWSGMILLPVAALCGKPEDWAVNFTRNQPGIELASWVDLPKAAFWFLQPDYLVAVKR